MKKGLNKNLFFSMTLDFLEKYIPQAHNNDHDIILRKLLLVLYHG
jgi:hypothetical protein